MTSDTSNSTLWKRIGLGAALAVPLVVVVLMAGVVPSMLMAAQRQALSATPADHGIAYEDVSLTTSDGVEINGWWMPDATPAGTDEFTSEPVETRGVIIFVHGANSNRADPYVDAFGLYKLLTKMQHNVLAIDMRNSGTSAAWGSGQLDWGRAETLDVLAAVDYAQTRGGNEPIIPFGVSMGGAAVLHAATKDKRIRGLILLDPMLDTYDTMTRGTVAAAGFPLALAHATTTAAGLFHGAPAFDDGLKKGGKTYDRPTLLIQDEHDPVNRRIHAEEIVAANRNIDLWVAPHPKADHPYLAEAGGWGTHVAAFQLYPDEVAALLEAYLTMVHAICDAEDLEAAASAPLAETP
jgi:pimeloyl-ACP methyl ester carboxylesterase